MNIHILCGGASSEHDISLRSARSIINYIDKDKYEVSYTYITRDGKFAPIGYYENEIENPEDLERECQLSVQDSIKEFLKFIEKIEDPLIIPVIHGTTGEDGHIQGFLTTLGLKYLGNNLKSSAICFDKAVTNDILEINHIPQAKYHVVYRSKFENSNRQDIYKEIFDKLGENVYVKPASNGSSVGVSKANKDNIESALEEAFKYDTKALVEEEMHGVELEVSVIGNENPEASLAGSYTTNREVFDYTAKYLDKTLVRNLPHDLSDDLSNKVRELAIDAYKATGCQDFARVDIFMDENDEFFVNEINTFPGMTPTSLSAGLWEVTDGTTYAQFLDRIIAYALERYEDA